MPREGNVKKGGEDASGVIFKVTLPRPTASIGTTNDRVPSSTMNSAPNTCHAVDI